MISGSTIIFYLLGLLTLISAILSVSTRQIFRAAIYLLFSLIGIAGLYFWLNYQFIAAVQIIVYVGGIVVLIIFSIFLTQQSGKEMPRPIRSRSVYAVLAAVFGLAFTGSLLYNHRFAENSQTPFTADVADIGTQMLSTTEYGYVLPFEVVSILLLAAMVGCIVIAMRSEV